jgi:hypothetical protein
MIIVFFKKIIILILKHNTKDSLEDRFVEEEIHGKDEIFISMSVDATEVPIHRPEEIQEDFYSGKSKCHTLKYEVGVRVAWVSGP